MKIANKQIKDGVVDSYILSKYESGIVHLLINTTDKWCEFEPLETNKDNSSIEIYNLFYNVCVLKIEELNSDLVSKMVKTVVQEKDQINFLFFLHAILSFYL